MREHSVQELLAAVQRLQIPLTAAHIERLLTHAPHAEAQPSLAYPWPHLEAHVGDQGLPLLAYGSLMNRQSALRTLADYDQLRPTPVIAFGGQRCYEYEMPTTTIQRYTDPIQANQIAALNVVRTGSLTDCFNAVLLAIPVADIPGLREREKQYDLIPFVYLRWDGTAPAVAYALSSPADGRGKVSRSILPHPGYHRTCFLGAHSFGAAFGECFLRTTFLNDGRAATTLGEGAV